MLASLDLATFGPSQQAAAAESDAEEASRRANPKREAHLWHGEVLDESGLIQHRVLDAGYIVRFCRDFA